MKELRAAILRMRSYGDSMGEIAKNLRIPKATVQKAIQRGTVEDRPGRGRKRMARTPENTRKIKAKIQRNSSSRKNSKRNLGKVYGISHESARRIMVHDLKLKSWKPLKRHELTKKKRDIRKAGSEPAGLRNLGISRSKSVRKTPRIDKVLEESHQEGVG